MPTEFNDALVVLCSLDRVDAARGYVLNLSVALKGNAAAPDDHFFFPWQWKIEKVRYAFLSGDAIPQVLAAGEADIRQPSPRACKDSYDRLTRQLETKFQESKAQITNLQWAPVSESQGTYSQPLSEQAEHKPWPALLGKVARYPYPIPQFLNLSLLIDAPEVPNGAALFVAAPILEASAGGMFPQAKYAPSTSDSAQFSSLDQRVMYWQYEPANAVPLMAYFEPVRLNQAAPAVRFLDLKTLWIEKPAGASGGAFEGEWQTRLEHHMADSLDLSQRVIEWMSSDCGCTLLKTRENLLACRKMAIAALADAYHPGVATAPNGGQLLRQLANSAGIQWTEQQWNKITGQASTLYTAYEDWAKQLRGVAALSSLPALRPEPSGVDPVALAAELQDLHRKLADTQEQKVLLDLLEGIWRCLLEASGFSKAEANASAGKLRNAVDQDEHLKVHLRHRLMSGLLGRFWGDFVKSNRASNDPEGHQLVKKCFPVYIEYYFLQRFQPGLFQADAEVTTPNSPPAFTPPVPASEIPEAVAAELTAFIRNWATQKAENWIPQSPGPTKVPHELTIQVDQLDSDRDPFKDLLNRVSGVGVLLKEEGGPNSNWRCLNMVEGYIGGQYFETLHDDGGDAAPLLVPYRLDYSSALRQVCISYNNAPLIAESPLSVPKMTPMMLQSQQPGNFERLIDYRYSRHAMAKMYGLTFGKRYLMLPFIVGNGGILPAEIARNDAPWELDPAKLAGDPHSPGVRSSEYKRRVPIGALRVFGGKKKDELQVPAYPPTVRPRAADVAVLQTRDATGDNGLDKRDDAPLILLSWTEEPGGQRGQRFQFFVQRPATSWDCWSRWVAFDSGTEQRRKGVIAEFYRKAEANRHKAKDEVTEDLLVDDPAASEWIFARLQRVNDKGELDVIGGTAQPSKGQEWLRGEIAGTGALDSERRTPVKVECFWCDNDAEEGFRLTPAGLLQVGVKRGEVYLLSLHATVSIQGQSRFAEQIVDFEPNKVLNPKTGGQFYVVPGYRLRLEAAIGTLPNSAQLWQHFEPRYQTGGVDEAGVLVSFDPVAEGDFRHVASVELRRQVWRWQGRHCTVQHPELDPTAGDPAQKLLKWEAVEFGDRPDSDRLDYGMEISGTLPNGTRQFHYYEALESASRTAAKSSLKAELRSLHFRFGITAVSRYQGILPPNAETVRTAELGVAGNHRRWKPLYVPCRQRGTIDAPRLKLVLPLTEPYNKGSVNPGLLVVLNETWYEIGGIGETLEARVATVPDPDEDPKNVRTFYYQMGPDPILGKFGEQETLPTAAAGENKVTFSSARIQGPVGHYFDTTSETALYNATSFVIPAPTVAGWDEKASVAWYMAQIQLRRRIVTKAPGRTPAATQNESQTVELSSDWTSPAWVQYLPAFSRYSSDSTPVETQDLRLAVKLGAGNIVDSAVLVDQQGMVKEIGEFASSQKQFELYLVITRLVVDVMGKPDQEQYVGLFEKSGSNWKNVDPVPGQRDAGNLAFRARVLEVQRVSGKPKVAGNLWSDLFESAPGSDAPARIVRISAPIESHVERHFTCLVVASREAVGLREAARR